MGSASNSKVSKENGIAIGAIPPRLPRPAPAFPGHRVSDFDPWSASASSRFDLAYSCSVLAYRPVCAIVICVTRQRAGRNAVEAARLAEVAAHRAAISAALIAKTSPLLPARRDPFAYVPLWPMIGGIEGIVAEVESVINGMMRTTEIEGLVCTSWSIIVV